MHFFAVFVALGGERLRRRRVRCFGTGIYTGESAKRGGKVLKIKYPWDEDRECEFEEAE